MDDNKNGRRDKVKYNSLFKSTKENSKQNIFLKVLRIVLNFIRRIFKWRDSEGED